jgi:sulfur relay (sulfurtransferase) DsrC/TusE family protein
MNDFKELYNETLSNLENLPNLADFQKLHVFERNNWNNFNIIPFMRVKMALGKDKYTGRANLYDVNAYFTDINLKNAMVAGKLPKVVGISPFQKMEEMISLHIAGKIKLTLMKELEEKKLVTILIYTKCYYKKYTQLMIKEIEYH